MPSINPQTSIKNVRAGHDVNGQIVNPVPVDFNLPLTISNPEDPEQQTPIALHVIVDNASDFPSGGGGGGDNMRYVILTYGFANAVESMVSDPVTGLMLQVTKMDNGGSTKAGTSPVCMVTMIPSEYENGTIFMVPADTDINFQIWDSGQNTMTPTPSLCVIVNDMYTDEDLTDVCLPYYFEDSNKYEVVNDTLYIDSFIVPSSVEHGVVVSFMDTR